MTSGLPQQNPNFTAPLPKADPLPQHGQQPDKRCMQRTTPHRKPTPRPGH